MAHASQSDQKVIDALAEENVRIRVFPVISGSVHHTAKADDNRGPASLYYQKICINEC